MTRPLIAFALAFGLAVSAGSVKAASTTVRMQPVPPETRAPVHYDSGGMIFFKVQIGDREVEAVLDSGAGGSVIDMGLARDLGLSITPGNDIVVGLGGMQTDTLRVANLSFVIPGEAKIELSSVLTTNLEAISAAAGHKIGLVVGDDVLSFVAVLVDPSSRTFRLANSDPSRTLSGAAVIDFPPGRPVVSAVIGGETVRLTLDTGFGYNQVSLSPAAFARALKDAPTRESQMMGMDGVWKPIRQAQAPSMSIGPMTINSVVVGEIPSFDPSLDGTIGLALLSRYRFALDIKAGKLWLVPLPAVIPPIPRRPTTAPPPPRPVAPP